MKFCIGDIVAPEAFPLDHYLIVGISPFKNQFRMKPLHLNHYYIGEPGYQHHDVEEVNRRCILITSILRQEEDNEQV